MIEQLHNLILTEGKDPAAIPHLHFLLNALIVVWACVLGGAVLFLRRFSRKNTDRFVTWDMFGFVFLLALMFWAGSRFVLIPLNWLEPSMILIGMLLVSIMTAVFMHNSGFKDSEPRIVAAAALTVLIPCVCLGTAVGSAALIFIPRDLLYHQLAVFPFFLVGSLACGFTLSFAREDELQESKR